jgi:CRP/FNR family transcriptional regulator, cyclic AMP receptor protein
VITVQKLLFLRNVALFGRMPSRELGRIASVTSEGVFPAGSNIFKEADYGETMYLIVEGQVRIHKGDTTLTTLGEKAYFGEMSILDGEPRSASATAVTDCLLLCINRKDFHDILAGNFAASLSIIQTLTRRIRKAEAAAAGRPAPSADDSQIIRR